MRPPYTAEDYERLLKMHRVGASAERIALVLDRSTASVMSHFKKHKPVWNAAGEYTSERPRRDEFSKMDCLFSRVLDLRMTPQANESKH